MTQPFTIIVPTPVNDANFVSSTVPENDHAEYNAGNTYNLNDRVIVTTGYHGIYQSLVASNTGNFPPDNPDKWVKVWPTNRWALFDNSGSTSTTNATSPMTFVVTGDRISGMAFLGLKGVDSVHVQASNPVDGTYFDETFEIPDQAIVSDWFDYFYSPIIRKEELIVTGIPAIGDSTYTITLTGSNIELNTFSMGQVQRFGFTEFGATVGIVDYSKKEVDEFGQTTLVPRSFAKRVDATFMVNKDITDQLQRQLANIRAKPTVFVGAQDQYESLTVFGFYRDFSIVIQYPTKSLCTMQIEGLA